MAVACALSKSYDRRGFFGPEGREKQLERLTRAHLERLASQIPGLITEIDGVGAMLAFRLGDGSLKSTRELIRRCFYCRPGTLLRRPRSGLRSAVPARRCAH